VFRVGGASCAVPGTTAGLEALHRAHGTLPWREVVAPAAELARAGVELSRPQAHLHAILDLILRHTAEGRRVYSRADGSRLQPGDVLRLPDLGDTLDLVAAEGAGALYSGELAAAIAATVAENGGRLTSEDLAAYEVVWREPVRVPYLGYEVVSNPPPSSGGILIAYGLALLERIGTAEVPGSAEALAALAGVMREQTRVRDDLFAAALHDGSLRERLLDDRALADAVARIAGGEPGLPEPAPAGGTTHVSAVDAAGNAASLSSSTGSGSGVIVPGTGVHLNTRRGYSHPHAGAPAEPGHRLTSMMAPTVVLGPEGPRVVVGSAGSVRLRGAIMQVIVNVIGHGLDVAAAIDAPRVHVEDAHVHCEGGFDAAELDRLESWGHHVVRWRRPNLYFGGTNAVGVRADGTLAAAVAVQRRDLAVAARALAERVLEPHCLERGLEQLDQPAQSRARRGRGEQLLIRFQAEVDPRSELPDEVGRVTRRDVDVALGRRREVAEDGERALHVLFVLGVGVVVDDLLDDPRLERAAGRQLEQPEPFASLDDDVQAAVLEPVDDRGHVRARADLVHGAVARREHEPELAVGLDALADQLAVARLEDVQRDPLRRHEHERQGEESELRHAHQRTRGGVADRRFGRRRR
jgi:gamma-glutamyltranspeptidase/glutathione hydrolase